MICLKCENPLHGRQIKFCSLKCNNQYNFKKYGGHEYNKKLRSASPRAYLSRLRSIKNRADTLSLDYLEDLYYGQGGLCAITNEFMTYEQAGNNTKVPTNISIDRIDSNIGYLPGNIQLVCYRVNVMKLDGDLDELIGWCQKVIHAHKKDPRS